MIYYVSLVLCMADVWLECVTRGVLRPRSWPLCPESAGCGGPERLTLTSNPPALADGFALLKSAGLLAEQSLHQCYLNLWRDHLHLRVRPTTLSNSLLRQEATAFRRAASPRAGPPNLYFNQSSH